MKDDHYVVYCDGGCKPNPGVGGYGIVVLHGKEHTEISGGSKHTTNNRMELLGAIKGLKAVPKKSVVQLYSDSQYVVKGMNEWTKGWVRRNWVSSTGTPVVNQDLWLRLLKLSGNRQVTFTWVKGHASNKHNNRCDSLASAEVKRRTK